MIALSSPRQCPKLPWAPTNAALRCPTCQLPLPPHTLSRVTHHPMHWPLSFYLLNAEGKGQPFSKFVISFPLFFFFFFFCWVCVCYTYWHYINQWGLVMGFGRVDVGWDGIRGLLCWGTMHKLYCVWIKRITYAYIFTRVYVYIYAYQQINKKIVRYSVS